MRILSIDLPWSTGNGRYGFAWIDLSGMSAAVQTDVQRGAAAAAAQVFASFAQQNGPFDVILVDQPIGGAGHATTGYRDVERAFGNSSFVVNGPKKIQAPRFQPGAAHAARGTANAAAAGNHLGHTGTVVVESFPQLTIPSLIDFANRSGLTMGAVTGLKAHKGSGTSASLAASQLVAAFGVWTGVAVSGPAQNGQPDAVDAVLALLPALEIFAPRGGGTAGPVWLHSSPPGAPMHPSSVGRSLKSGLRAQWMSPMAVGRVGPSGIRSDGILSLRLPGWPAAAATSRLL